MGDEKFYHVVEKQSEPPRAEDPQQVQGDRPYAVDWSRTEPMTVSDPHREGNAR